MASLVLSQNHLSATDIQQVDPDTRIRLQALLEASGDTTSVITAPFSLSAKLNLPAYHVSKCLS